MNISARRVLLQKILRGAVGLAGAGLAGSGSQNYPRGTPIGSQFGPAGNSGEDIERSTVSRLLNKQLEAHFRKSNMLQEAVANMDLDLQVLRSTSPTWRAWQMYDRVKKRRSITDKINERIEMLWREPFDKIKGTVMSWVTGQQ